MNRDNLSAFEQALLAKMSGGYFAIYRVEAVDAPGVISVSNVFDETRFTLLDYQFAGIFKVGTTLAGHIIGFGEFSIQSWFPLPMTDKLALDNAVINALGSVYYDHHLNPDNRAELARAIISAAVRLGFTEKFS